MVDHHIQRQILRLVGAHEQARFTDIRPEGLENNAFQYHLKQLLHAKLITKNDDGSYSLTGKGTGEFISSHLASEQRLAQAHAIFLLAVQSGEKWLLATRKVQPQLGLTGFLHGEPVWEEPLLEAARKRLLAKSGLEADFTIKGSGYITITKEGDYSSFVHATLLHATATRGELDASFSHNTLSWFERQHLHEVALIPSMQDLFEILDGTASPFFDLRYEM